MQEGAEYGPVQAIDISFESEWLGCGHQEGQVVVWDVLQGSPVKTFIGDFKTSITFVRFIDNKKNRLLACSLDGIAKLFRISNVLLMWVVETQLVLSGAAGPILAMANLNPGNQHNPVDNYSLVAFCTTKKVAIVAIQQTIRVMHQIPRPDGVRGSCLPYLAWREVIIRDSKGMAISRNIFLHFAYA
jgi:WD40 repeat protein